MECRICHNKSKAIFKIKILNKYDIQYFICPKCGYLTTEDPFWLNEAYTNAIAATDVGIILRNIEHSKKLLNILYFIFGKNKRYIDISGGYGILCRIMRDYGFNYYWEDKYCKNLFSQGFEAAENETFSAASLVEVIEHTINPIDFIQSIFKKRNIEMLIFTTELYDDKELSPKWWYFTPETGQHISFFKKETLLMMSNLLNLKLYTISGTYIFSKNSISTLTIKALSISKIQPFLNNYAKKNLHSRLADDYSYICSKIIKGI